MLLELKHDTALERSPFFGLQGNQFPSQCDISCILSLEKAFFGAKSAANQFAPVFAGFMHLAWLSMVWYVDERKSENNLERSSFLAIDSRFLVKCNRRWNLQFWGLTLSITVNRDVILSVSPLPFPLLKGEHVLDTIPFWGENSFKKMKSCLGFCSQWACAASCSGFSFF